MKSSKLYSFIKKEYNQKNIKKKNIIKLHEPTFGPDEIYKFTRQLISTNVTMGKEVAKLEKKFCDFFGFKYAVASNSGSSANLLMISALVNKLFKNGLKKGDEIIVPSLAWSTSIFPLTQYGLIPVFVDCDLETFNIKPSEIKKAISKKTKGVLAIPIYGNPCKMEEIVDICKKNNLILIEDSCESMGAKFKKKFLGNFGLASSFSFYFSHHITCLEGGITVTNDFNFYELMKMIRSHGWIRNLSDTSKNKWIKKYPKIDPKFLFVSEGYNVRLTEPQASMAMIQLKKLDKFVSLRRRNANYLLEKLSRFKDFFLFQIETEQGFHSWFGFTLIIKNFNQINRNEICSFLEKNKIETRVIVAGNFTKQPVMKDIKYKVFGKLINTNTIMDGGFSFGIHQGITLENLDYIYTIIKKYLKIKKLI